MGAAAETVSMEKEAPIRSSEPGGQLAAPALPGSVPDPFVERLFGGAPAQPPDSAIGSLSVQRLKAPVLQRAQRLYGNRASQRIVMRARILQRQCACGGACAKCQEEEEQRALQRRSAARAPAEFDGIPAGRGEPLDAAARAPLEAHFGADLADVRVHAGPEAAESATRLDALAYTSGRDIYFAAGMYAPSSSGGRRLLAHEVAHVVQQSSGKEPAIATKSAHGVKIGAPDDPLEEEAEKKAEQFMSGAPPEELTDEEQRKRRESSGTLRRSIQRQGGTAQSPAPVSPPPGGAAAQTASIPYAEFTLTDDPVQLKAELVKITIARGIHGPDDVLVWIRFPNTQICNTPGNPSEACLNYVKAKAKIINVLEKVVPEVRTDIQKTQAAFLGDIDAAATQNLFENRAYIMQRKEALGLAAGAKNPLSDKQKAEWRHQIQDLAWEVWELKQAQDKLRKTVIGYYPLAFAGFSPIYFDPDNAQRDPYEGVQGTRPKWEDLRFTWDLIGAEIADIAGKYPEIYGALASKAPQDELLNMSRLIPEAFEKNTSRLLDEMLARIDDVEQKLGKSIDLLDLKPLITRLLQGGAAPSGHTWGTGFDHKVAQSLVDDREQGKKAADTLATAAEIIGLLIATFASGGLALLIGGTLAVGVPIARGISDWSKANELDEAAKATPKPGTDIVAQAQADLIKAKAVGEIVRGVFNAITLGTAAAWQAVRGALTAAKLGRIGELPAAEAAQLIEKALGQLGAAKTVASSGKTIEELLAIIGEGSPAVGPLRAYNAQLIAKPFAEITPADLAASEALQNRVFDMARGVQARQQALADRILAKVGKGGSANSILKRPDVKTFSKGVLEKSERNAYDTISQMDDMVRGRFDMPDKKSVEAVAKALTEQSEFKVVQNIPPRIDEATGVVRYPRYHIILQDAETGLTHEWQVGTEALSKLYETPGVTIPEELTEAAAQLGKKFNPDLHDIEYDVFQSINKTDPGLAARYGLPEFIAKVAQASQKAGAQGAAFKQLGQTTAVLHTEASSILARLVQEKGAEWVAQFFH